MSIMELGKLIGRIAAITVEDTLTVRVVIRDVKSSYGRELVLIEPVDGAGSGSKWVRLDRLHMINYD